MSKKLICLTTLLVLGSAMAASATPGPVGWWKFDETSGKVAVDSVGARNGDLLPLDPNNPAQGPVWVAAGKLGGAVEMDGTDDFVQLAIGDLVSSLSSTTVACWLNWTNTSTWARAWDFGTNNTNYMFLCPRNSGNRIQFAIRTPAIGEQVATSSPRLQPGWHHLAMSLDATAMTMTLILDGVQVGTVATTVLLPKDLGVTTQNYVGKSQWPDPLYKGQVDDLRIYDRALTADEAANAMVGGLGYGLANTPTPANKATDVMRDQKLSFAAGQEGKTHDIYFGTDAAAVTAADASNPMGVLVKAGATSTTFNPGRLQFGATYYWRVDEIGASPEFKLFKGNVWSFTVEPFAYAIARASITPTASSQNSDTMSPVKTIDGSGLNATTGEHGVTETDMWLSSATGTQPTWIQYAFDKVYSLNEMKVWNSNQALESIIGYGAKQVTVEYGVDPNALTKLGDFEFAQASGAPGYTANTIVDFAGKPAKFVKLTITSNWGGIFPQFGLSEVQFSRFPVIASSPIPANNATGIGTKVDLSWRPSREAASHEVYLSIDQDAVVKGTALAGKPSAPAFSTPVELNRTYYWKVNEVNNAEDPSAWEGDVWNFKTVQYLNIVTFKDTADRTVPFDTGRGWLTSVTDWTAGGATTLVVWFTPTPGSAPAQLALRVGFQTFKFWTDTKDTAGKFRQQWNIPLADLRSTGVNLQNVKGIEITPLSEGTGSVVINEMRLYRDAPPMPVLKDPGTSKLEARYKMEGDVKDSSGKGLDGTATGDPVYESGPAGMGQALVCDAVDDYVTLPIGDLISTCESTTFSLWVKWTRSGGSWQRILDFGSGTNNYAFLCSNAGSTTANPRFAMRTPAVGERVANGVARLTTDWQHLAVTIDKDASPMTITLYVDGIPVGTNTTTILPKDMGVTTQNWIAKSQYSNDALYKGSVDDLRIYKRVLTEGEIRWMAGDR